jgi:hypothetical protein
MNNFLETYFSNLKCVRWYLGGTWEYWTTEDITMWSWYKLDNPSDGVPPYSGLLQLKRIEMYEQV